MNYDLTKPQKELRKQVKRTFTTELKEEIAEANLARQSSIREIILKTQQALRETVYLDLSLEEDNDLLDLVIVQETLSQISPSFYLSIEFSVRLLGRLVARYGNTTQKETILTGLRSGQAIGAVALSEGGMNIETSPIDTTIEKRDGKFILQGEKAHVVNASVADWIAVAAKMDNRVTFVLLPNRTPGLEIGERFSTLGCQGVCITEIKLNEVEIEKEWLIGPFEEDKILMDLRQWEDQILTIAGLGGMHNAYQAALKYAKKHKSGGKPIIAYQEIGFKLAEMFTLYQTSQWMIYRSAWATATQNTDAKSLIHCAKVFCTESSETIASESLRILGAQGYLTGNRAEESFRNAKYFQIAGTSNEISRMKIGDEILSPYWK